jgi:hypothetical protein
VSAGCKRIDLIGVPTDSDRPKLRVPFRDGTHDGRPLGTDREPVGGILDVYAGDGLTAAGQKRRPDAQIRVGDMSSHGRLSRFGEQRLDIDCSGELRGRIGDRNLKQRHLSNAISGHGDSLARSPVRGLSWASGLTMSVGSADRCVQMSGDVAEAG